MVDVIGSSGAEQRLQQGVCEDAVIEDLLEAVDSFDPADCSRSVGIDEG